MNLKSFYNTYHQKNNNYNGVIGVNNFTYFYILRFLQKAYSLHFGQQYQAKMKKLNVLDVGCGVGTLALFLTEVVKSVKGIDVSSRAIKIAKQAQKQAKIKNCSFENVSVEALAKQLFQFDMIVCTEVIEHIKEDRKFLENLHSRLNEDGLLILTTPSKENLMYKWGFYKNFDQQVGHVRRYTAREIAGKLKQAGFKIKAIDQTEGFLRNALFTTRLGFLIRFIRGPLVKIFHFFDQLSVLLLGPTDILTFAVKKAGVAKNYDQK